MNIALWILQVLLSAMFLMAGTANAAQPIDVLAERMTWVTDVAPGLVRFIGLAEVLGAVGLILPAMMRTLPWLTPLASGGLAVVMLLAAGFHGSRDENDMVGLPVVVALLAATVGYGRWKLAPIAPRRT